MFRFKKKQEVLDICGTKVGGQPGRYPTVLAGTIFYNKHSIIKEDKKGIFDKKKAEELLFSQEENSDKSKNPCIVHVYASTSTAIEKYIDFVSETTQTPFIVDSSDMDTRSHAARYVEEIGVNDRVIYNSINMSIQKQEKEILKDSNVDTSIVLAYNAKDNSISGKIDILNNGASLLDSGLFDIAKECNINKCLIDTGMTTLGQGAGNALRATLVLKSLYGLPTGNGIHNAISSWPWLKKTYSKEVRKAVDTATAALEIGGAADFVLYGPIGYSDYIFPIAAMADSFMAEASKDIGQVPIDEHPFNVLL